MKLEDEDRLFIIILLHHTQIYICISMIITAEVLGDQNNNRVKLSNVLPGT